MRILLLFVLILSTHFLQAQMLDDKIQQVKNDIIKCDSIFWKAYNDCDTATLVKYFSPDVEFYHDKSGLLSDSKSLMKSIQTNLCSNENYHLRRESIKGSEQIFLLQNNNTVYGAVHTGKHIFYIWEKGKKETADGKSHFTHLWMLLDKKWKMTRILSYDHTAIN